MNTDYAKDRLLIHGSALANHEDWGTCFIGQLKPYRGRLSDSVYEDIINCLLTLFDEIQKNDLIDKRISAGVHGIIRLGTAWVSDPESGLRQSGRIPAEEVIRLEQWLNNISDAYHEMLWFKTDKAYLVKKYAL
ncbi:MAG: hypothetical protein KUG78_04065 [Kangiellaceae bacterium]|nr:hypothetical protein [Kangiellaceae bacterium]